MRAILALLLLTACPLPAVTRYHPVDATGGYADWSRAPGSHHIEIAGNKHTSPTIVRMYFNRRAVDLCRSEGWSSYVGEPQTSEGQRLVPAKGGSGGYVDANSGFTTSSYVGEHVEYTGASAVGDVTCSGERIRPVPIPADPLPETDTAPVDYGRRNL